MFSRRGFLFGSAKAAAAAAFLPAVFKSTALGAPIESVAPLELAPAPDMRNVLMSFDAVGVGPIEYLNKPPIIDRPKDAVWFDDMALMSHELELSNNVRPKSNNVRPNPVIGRLERQHSIIGQQEARLSATMYAGDDGLLQRFGDGEPTTFCMSYWDGVTVIGDFVVCSLNFSSGV
jgi:hypothetical protein